ncbi:ABC transporter ATP-binding protein [Enterobacter sp. RD4-1-1]|uniref:ABC transporter ATP-binding protein n=1 Tax=Enterobacter sp. RD4-1-1 TaxID=2986135 RepID=UPI0021E9903C|nr:ABC transporter ATP-binding protein [Enterobacter sp. RD4-1-1]MCV3773670.1 ABC transporter ATP-binding protein [Enterobacter sp. RD4-1-1]
MTHPIGIRLRRCARTFHRQHTALHPLDLDIQPGETLVLLGPSGCGKTTTLRIISGLESSDSGGEVWFDDRNVTALPIEKRKVGMVFQNYALFPNLNVAENISYGLRIQRMAESDIRQRVSEMMKMVDLSDLANRPIQALSGGQKQRVSLARALAARPKVLLFDEPLAALDAKLRDKLREDIGSLLEQLGITAVYVTHDQQEAMALGDRIAVMRHGRIEQIGTPREIYHHPATPFVADFVGSVNRLSLPDGDLWFRPEDIQPGPLAGAWLAGDVLHCTFLGQHQRMLVKVASGHVVQVDCPSRTHWQPGQRIGLHAVDDSLFTLSHT